jgi:hypothetical protein
MRNVHLILIGKPQGRGHVRDLVIDGKVILKLALKKQCECAGSTEVVQRDRKTDSMT